MAPRALLPLVTAAALTFGAAPLHAIVGGGAPSADGVGRNVVTIVGSRGNFCSGTMIAPKIALTAAHCVRDGATYKIVEYDAQRTPQLRDITQVATHPQFNLQTMLAHRATADVALLRVAIPIVAARQPPPLGAPLAGLGAGSRFAVAGIGVSVRGDGKSGGVVRAANLIATGRPGNLQIRLVDPAAEGKREGLGACTGDSGGPVFEDQQGGAVVIGVVSWSTGPNGTAGCGGMTGVTPLSLYRDWILQTARSWGEAL
jgi:hypothetical protein